MGFYSDMFNGGNVAGEHIFDGTALDTLKTFYDETRAVNVDDGERITIVHRTSREPVLLLLHKNGRKGDRDQTRDNLVFSITEIRKMPDEMQVAIYPSERVPGGRRPEIITDASTSNN